MSAVLPRDPLAPVIAPGETNASISAKISDATLRRPTGWLWIGGFLLSLLACALLFVGTFWLLYAGIGIF